MNHCQKHDKTSIHRKFGDREERLTEWVLHRLSRTVVAFAEQFTNPVIVFKEMSGIRERMQYGMYLNRRLYKLPFHRKVKAEALRLDLGEEADTLGNNR